MRKLLIFIVVALHSHQITVGQGDDDSYAGSRQVHSIGVGAGLTTGIGLLYRYYPGKFGIQTAFAPIYIDKKEAYLSLGFTFLYRLVQAEKVNFFLYEGNHFMYTNTDSEVFFENDNNTSSLLINNGLGMGVEVLWQKRVGFNFMAGYAIYNNFSSINITGEIGLFFLL